MSKTCRHFTSEQKAEIVCRHLAGKEPVSSLADEFGLQPSSIHGWVNLVLAQAERAFVRPNGKRRQEEAEARKIAHLEAKLANKNEVIAERAPPRSGGRQEHMQLKKELGGL
jgi:transposase